jgi:hypothetical protein
VSGADLYAAGYFTNAGGIPANHIARWDGARWSGIGSGTGGGDFPAVYALAVDRSGHLFVAGRFFFAGDKLSPFIAQANIIPRRGVIQNIGAGSGSVVLDCLGLPGTAYAVERATDVQFRANLTTLLTTNAPPSGRFRCTDSSPPGATAFYRLLNL